MRHVTGWRVLEEVALGWATALPSRLLSRVGPLHQPRPSSILLLRHVRPLHTFLYAFMSQGKLNPVPLRSGFDQNRVYSVSVLPNQGPGDAPSSIEKSLYDFIQGFRIGGEFRYR
jgi:hypothetical protein